MVEKIQLYPEDQKRIDDFRANAKQDPQLWEKIKKNRAVVDTENSATFDESYSLEKVTDFDLLMLMQRPPQALGINIVVFIIIAAVSMGVFLMTESILAILLLPIIFYFPARVVSRKMNEAARQKFIERYPHARGVF